MARVAAVGLSPELRRELKGMVRSGRWDGFAAWHSRARAAVDAARPDGSTALYCLKSDLANLSLLYSTRDYAGLAESAARLARG